MNNIEIKDIKIVALDLDGTTLNNEKEISKRTIEAFKQSMEKGVHIVISTGRTFYSLPKQLFEIEGLEYVITSNGAHISKLNPLKTVYENYLDSDAVSKLVNILHNTEYSVETFVGGRAYIDKAEFDGVKTNGSSFRDVQYILDTRNPIPNLYDFMLEHKTEVENISVNYEFLKDREKVYSLLTQVADVTVTSSFPHNFEIGGMTTSKASALKVLMNKLGITEEHLMACGDSPNDEKMIAMAGIGVAVSNGNEETKRKADYITDSNANEGVAKAIEKFVLKK